jgi:hypothetical protein
MNLMRRQRGTNIATVVTCLLLGQGCGSGPQCEEATALVAGDAWTFVEPNADVLWVAPADAARCESSDLQVQTFGDDVALEVDTRLGCGWATAMQPLRADIVEGDELQVRVFYFSQATFPAAQAEVAIAIGADIVMRELVDIPTESGLIAPRLPVLRDATAGTPVQFHIGNHGDNSWNLVELSAITRVPCENSGP